MARNVEPPADLISRIIRLEKRMANLERSSRRPNLLFRVYAASEDTTPPVTITSGSYVTAHLIEGTMQHSAVYIKVRATADVGTAGSVRLYDTANSATLWEADIPDGFNGVLEGIALQDSNRQYGADFRLSLHALRSTGSGNVRVGVALVYGRNAPTS